MKLSKIRHGLERSPALAAVCHMYFLDLKEVSVLGQEEGYTVKYTPSPEGVPESKARGNS